MYLPRIEIDHMRRLFKLREFMRRHGDEKVTIVSLISEALDIFLSVRERDIFPSRDR